MLEVLPSMSKTFNSAFKVVNPKHKSKGPEEGLKVHEAGQQAMAVVNI